MTTDPVPLSAESIDYWRKQVADRGEGIVDWPDNEVIALVARFLATLDEARATPSGDLAAAAQRVADLYEMGAGGDDWWTALDHLVAALRGSVSADSTAGLDVERLASVLWRLMKHEGWRINAGMSDLPPNMVAEYVARDYASPSTPPEATE